jgi:hypothetical protein
VSAPINPLRGRTSVSIDLCAFINVALSRYLSCTHSNVQEYMHMHVWRDGMFVLSLVLMPPRSYTSNGSVSRNSAKAARLSPDNAQATRA